MANPERTRPDSAHTVTKVIAYAYSDGRIGRADVVPDGAVEIARGTADRIERIAP